jgi:trans-aconitate methyltransferase
MLARDTDTEWERLARKDPYWAVLTSDQYRSRHLTDEGREEFFSSGREYVDLVMRTVREHVDPGFQPRRALDFGCGVGRVLVPLAQVAERVTGVDVSESMLAEARRNCEALALPNVELVRSDDDLSLVAGAYDLVHSALVFQHLPVKRGERLFERLIGKVDGGGVCVAHFPYAMHRRRRMVARVQRYVPFATNLMSALKGRGFFAPQMQMNTYDLDRLLAVAQRAGAGEVHLRLMDNWGVSSALLFFRKP